MKVYKRTIHGREELPGSDAWIGVMIEVAGERYDVEPSDRPGRLMVSTDPNGPVKRLVARFIGSVRHVELAAERVP